MERLLSTLLPLALYNELIGECRLNEITEIRLRLQRPVYYAIQGRYRRLGKSDFIATQSDLAHVLSAATKSSMYAYNSNLIDGYISYDGGIRIGLSGEGVLKNGALATVKNISSLCIRIPHYVEIKDPRIDSVVNRFDNTLIMSKPGYGKTTLLRYMIKSLSDKGYNVLVLDERGELGGIYDAEQAINLGDCTDIVLGIPKIKAYESQVRSMRPDIIATDEIFGEREIDCIADCIRCGVKVLATVHADNVAKLKNSRVYSKLLDNVRYLITIIGIGNISEVSGLRKDYA